MDQVKSIIHCLRLDAQRQQPKASHSSSVVLFFVFLRVLCG